MRVNRLRTKSHQVYVLAVILSKGCDCFIIINQKQNIFTLFKRMIVQSLKRSTFQLFRAFTVSSQCTHSAFTVRSRALRSAPIALTVHQALTVRSVCVNKAFTVRSAFTYRSARFYSEVH